MTDQINGYDVIHSDYDKCTLAAKDVTHGSVWISTFNEDQGPDDQAVAVKKKDLANVLRKIAEVAGVEMLILEKPKATLGRPVKASPSLSTRGHIGLSGGFNMTAMVSPLQALNLIWEMATAVGQVKNDDVDQQEIAKLIDELTKLGSATRRTIAAHLLRRGYRVDPSQEKPMLSSIQACNEFAGSTQ